MEELNFDNEEKIENITFNMINTYGEILTNKKYITNPAIAREEEIKKTLLILLSSDKSAIIIGKPGIGKTAIVEGIAYLIQKEEIPNALKDYEVININASAMVGTITIQNETKLKFQALMEELLKKDKVILFIDEIHTLVGDESLDFANMIKPAVARGNIKVIGATTNNEYEEFIVKDKAFVRRFTKVEVEEPNAETTLKILLGTLKKIESKTNVYIPYSDYVKERILKFIVNFTTEYNRVYGMGSRWPDIALNLVSMMHSQALYDNSKTVSINHIYNAIKETDKIYPDVKTKELEKFRKEFSDIYEDEKNNRS